MNDDLVNKSGDLVNDLVNDTISRAAALSALNGLTKIFLNNLPPTIDRADAVDAIKALPSAQPGQRNARVFQGIIVEYTTISTYPEYEGKPYFSIKYTENGQENRMCDSYETCIKGCPFGKTLNGKICSSWILENPVLAEDAIMKWAAEHPIMTSRMRFSEVFGFDLDMLYSVSEATIKWLDAEYKGGQDETD